LRGRCIVWADPSVASLPQDDKRGSRGAGEQGSRGAGERGGRGAGEQGRMQEVESWHVLRVWPTAQGAERCVRTAVGALDARYGNRLAAIAFAE
jgi:hypothetical protein